MAPKHNVTVKRETPRGDWKVTLPAVAFGPKGRNDAEGQFVTLVGEKDADVSTKTCQIRFGGRAGAIIEAVNQATPDKTAALVVASVRTMREAVAGGYENDARPGAISSPVVAVAHKSVSNLTGGAAVRKRLGSIPASQRVEKAPGILADAKNA